MRYFGFARQLLIKRPRKVRIAKEVGCLSKRVYPMTRREK
jgi:hypothetical protein